MIQKIIELETNYNIRDLILKIYFKLNSNGNSIQWTIALIELDENYRIIERINEN